MTELLQWLSLYLFEFALLEIYSLINIKIYKLKNCY